MNKLLLVLACLLPFSASGATWKKLGQVAGGELQLDTDSVVKAGSGVKAWTRIQYSSARTSPGGKSFKLVQVLHQYACSERTTTLLVQQFYANDANDPAPVENIRYEKFTPEDIAPDTPADKALKLVCADQKK